MVKIEYWHSDDLFDIHYDDGWRQRMYLDTVLSIPTYPFEEEGVSDANGVFDPEFQRWEKKFHFDIVAPEYILDALMGIQLHEYIYVDDNRVTDWEVTYDWDNRHAVINVSFTAFKIVKTDCCQNMQLGMQTSPLPGGVCYDPNLDPIIDIINYTDSVYTDPLSNGVHQGDRYLVYTAADVYDASFFGVIFEFVIDGWVEQDQVESYGVYCTNEAVNLYYDGSWWRKYPWIWMVDQAGVDTYHITGYALPETWVYPSYNDGTWHELDPVWAGEFNTVGFTVSVTEGDYTWKIDNETFSCEYDAANTLYKESGFWLINDVGDRFTQNVADDKWYV